MRRPVVLITGSSSGLGHALCAAFAARGCEVIAHARVASRAPAGYATVAADLSDPASAQHIHAQLEAQDLEPDIVVCNAAVGHYGQPASLDARRLDQLLEVNVWSPIALAHALLPGLQRRRGTLAFISSVAATVPAPDYAAYAASKAALDGFARNLRIELAGEVACLTLRPGGIRTDLHARSGVPVERSDAWRLADPASVAGALAARVLARRSGAIELGPALTHWAGRHLESLLDVALARRTDATRAQSHEPGGTQRALVTGAADGIGLALTRALIAAGVDVLGVDVDGERAARAIAELGPRLRIVAADLTNGAALAGLARDLEALGPYDLVVQNAGINAVGAFATSDLAAQRRVFDVNLRAPLRLTTALLAARALQPGARLVFMSSLSHYAGYPGAAVYAATKDGLAHFARSIDAALRPSGISTLRIHPGPTRTAHAARYSPDNRREARRMPPETLAAHILRAVERGDRVLVPGIGNRLFAELGRWLPGLTEAILRRTLLEKMGAPEPQAAGNSQR